MRVVRFQRAGVYLEVMFDTGEVFLEEVDRTTGGRKEVPWPAAWPSWITGPFLRARGFRDVFNDGTVWRKTR